MSEIWEIFSLAVQIVKHLEIFKCLTIWTASENVIIIYYICTKEYLSVLLWNWHSWGVPTPNNFHIFHVFGPPLLGIMTSQPHNTRNKYRLIGVNFCVKTFFCVILIVTWESQMKNPLCKYLKMQTCVLKKT